MTVTDQNSETPIHTSDVDLVLRTRSGDVEAFGELWSRHYRSGMTVARSITSRIDADDLVQEAYARIFQAIRRGGGPNGSFRAYLFTSIRNTAAAWGRANRESPIDELDVLPDPATTEQATDDALDRSLTARAFRSLPSRWQEVLWYTEIEQMAPSEVAPLLGMSAGAVSQLAFRAREGLREAWIQAHLASAPEDSDCPRTIEALGAYARGNLSRRDHDRVERHLAECTRCTIVAAEAKDVSNRLALVLLPLVLGVTGAGAYAAALQGGGAPIVALAAMPSGVIDGAGVAGAGVAGGAAGGVGGSGGAGGGASGAAGAGAGASGGILTGAGIIAGASIAAVAVAGVVAAAAILPGLSSNPGAGALSQASALGGTPGVTAELSPAPGIEPLVVPLDDDSEPSEEPPAPQPRTEPADEPTPPTAEESAPAPSAPRPPSGENEGGGEEPAAPAPEDEDEAGSAPGEDGGPEGPGEEEPGVEEPGTEEPGTEEPGTEEPGTEEPGTEEPGTEEPGTEEPGTEEPGGSDDEGGTEAPVPTTAITWDPAILERTSGSIRATIPVHGTPGTVVEMVIGGFAPRTYQIELNEAGSGAFVHNLQSFQLLGITPVTLQYRTAEGVVLARSTNFAGLGISLDRIP